MTLWTNAIYVNPTNLNDVHEHDNFDLSISYESVNGVFESTSSNKKPKKLLITLNTNSNNNFNEYQTIISNVEKSEETNNKENKYVKKNDDISLNNEKLTSYKIENSLIDSFDFLKEEIINNDNNRLKKDQLDNQYESNNNIHSLNSSLRSLKKKYLISSSKNLKESILKKNIKNDKYDNEVENNYKNEKEGNNILYIKKN